MIQKIRGFGLIEIIVAMGIFLIVASVGVTTVVHTFSTNRLGDEETEAMLFSQEGIEAARSIRNLGWDDPFLATDCSSGCGTDNSGGTWAWSGTENTISASGGRNFTRVILVEQSQRDGSNDIVESGGTPDPDTYKVTSTVTWDFSPTRNNRVEVVSYLTQYIKAIGGTPTPTPTPTGTPTPTPTPTATPTPTPGINSCTAYCQSLTYSAGTCRKNTQQCNANGETREAGGDQYCTGGANADTCCCAP